MLVIYNPCAGGDRGKKIRTRVTDSLERQGFGFEIFSTKGPHHAEEMAARAAAAGNYPIIAAGGDGTVSEVVNGMLRAAPGKPGPLGILPLGSANDLAYALSIPASIPGAVEIIARCAPLPIDVGRVNKRYFVNNVGLGLESFATALRDRIRIPGLKNYSAAAVLALLRKPEWRMKLLWDGYGEYQGPVSLVSVCNGIRSGGKFRIAPHADPADGLLTMVYGHARSRRRLFMAMLKTLPRQRNTHVHMAGVREIPLRELAIQSIPATPVHIDGELVPPSDHLSFTLLPGILPVFREGVHTETFLDSIKSPLYSPLESL
ncbi:MAG: diacylglycerol/lipid kinase family protein [Desulfovibrionales bacterium]